ncbi:MAG: GNAT family N-acetyltransferase [Acetatifactor sp.]
MSIFPVVRGCRFGRVLKEYHRNGIGQQLWKAFLQYARENSYEYAQVKSVPKGHYKEYDITNAFYEKLGFREFECFPTFWEEWNPCQVYVKYIGAE